MTNPYETPRHDTPLQAPRSSPPRRQALFLVLVDTLAGTCIGALVFEPSWLGAAALGLASLLGSIILAYFFYRVSPPPHP